MLSSWVTLLALLGNAAATPAAEVPPPSITISLDVTLKVHDRDREADALVKEAEARGGYFTSRGDDHVVFRIPNPEVETFVAKVESVGLILVRQRQAADVTMRLEEMRTRLASREKVLQHYFEVLRDATVQAVVTVEQQMTQLVQQIEQLRGQLRLLEHQLAFATVTVRFSFAERRAPVRTGTSSFAWLNTVNLVDVLGEVGYAE